MATAQAWGAIEGNELSIWPHGSNPHPEGLQDQTGRGSNYAKGCSYDEYPNSNERIYQFNGDADAVVGGGAGNQCDTNGVGQSVVRYCGFSESVTTVSVKVGFTFTAGTNAGDDSTCVDGSGLTVAEAAAVAAATPGIETAAEDAYKVSAEQNATIAAAKQQGEDDYKGSAQFDADAEAAYLATLDACGVSGGSITDVAECPSQSIDLTSDSDCQTAKDYFNAQCNCADYS